MGSMTGGARGYCGSGAIGRARFIGNRPGRGLGRRRSIWPATVPASREQEINLLQNQADALRNELKQLEAELVSLTAEKKQEG
jgi:hypothetical protein